MELKEDSVLHNVRQKLWELYLGTRYVISKGLHWLYFKTLAPQMRNWNMDQYMAGTIRDYLKVFYESERSGYFYWDREYHLKEEDNPNLADRLLEISDEAYRELYWTFDMLSNGVQEPDGLVRASLEGKGFHTVPLEDHEGLFELIITGPSNKEAEEALEKWRQDTEERIDRNMKLFIKAFRGFWD